MTVGDIARLDVKYAFGGQDCITTLHFRYKTTLSSENGLIDNWTTACQTLFLAMYPPSVRLTGLTATQVWPGPLDAQRGRVDQVRNSLGTATNYAGQPLAPWFAEDIRLYTAGRGRSRHGRFFLTVPTEDSINGNALEAIYGIPRGAYTDALKAAYMGATAQPDFNLVVYSRKYAYIPNTHPPQFDLTKTTQDVARDVTVLTPAGVLTTQRSRRA